MVGAHELGRRTREDRLGDLRVKRLGAIGTADAGDVDEPLLHQAAELVDDHERIAADRGAEEIEAQRRARHREHAEHLAQRLCELGDAPAKRGMQRIGAGLRTRHQLEEQRVTAGLADELLRAIAVTDEQVRERARIDGVERSERHHRQIEIELGELREPCRGLRDSLVVGAQANHERDRRRLGRRDQLREQRQALRRRPLDVVDHDDHVHHVRDARDQLAQRDQRLALELGSGCARRRGHRQHTREDRKQPRDRFGIGRHERAPAFARQARQHARQAVEQRFPRVEPHVLADATPPRAHEIAALAKCMRDLREQPRLADPRRARYDAYGRPEANVIADAEQRRELLLAADERVCRAGRRGAVRARCRRRRIARELGGHCRRRRALRRIARQQRHAQAIEIGRNLREQHRGWQRIEARLVVAHLRELADVRRPTDERLVEHRADRVHIGRGADRAAQHLLGRHVLDGAGEQIGIEIGLARGKPEIEQHHAAVGADANVRRFDVAMNDADRVECREPVRELRERHAQPEIVEARLRQLAVPGAFAHRAVEGHRREVVVNRRIFAAGDVAQQIGAVDQLHREAPPLIVLEQLAEAHQVLVAYVGRDAKLVLELLDRLGPFGVEQLQRDVDVELAVDCLVDRAHPAGAELPDHGEAVRDGDARTDALCGHTGILTQCIEFAPMRAAVIAVFLWSQTASANAPIIGGTVDQGDPAVVMLAAYPSNMSTLFTCTAIVISPTALLTAAHCVDHPGYTFGVYYGADASAYSTLAELAPQLAAVASVQMDPGYQSTTPFFGDIAVVNLVTPIAITPLAFSRDAPTDALDGMPVKIVGYGQTVYNTPNQVRYSATSTIVSLGAVDTIFIGDSNTRTCVGDSGGPALLGNVVIGVDSYSDTTGCTDPSYFRRTDVFADFIDQYAGTMPPPTDIDAGVSPDAPLLPGDSTSKSGGCSTGAGAGPAGGLLVLLLLLRNRRDRRRFAV